MLSYFQFEKSGTNLRTEILAGFATFLTMSYIIFVQPAVLSGAMFGFETGMDFGSVMVATCLASAIATLMMGLWARYPIGLAPGMGANFFFILTAFPVAQRVAPDNPWQVLLGVIFIEGVIFMGMALLRIRERFLNAVSPSMKNGIAVGIGLFIAFIGLQNCGLVVDTPGTLLTLNAQFLNPDLIVFFTGITVTAVLIVRRIRGAILMGIVSATILAAILRALIPALGFEELEYIASSKLMTMFHYADGVVAMPPSVAPTFFQMDVLGALAIEMIPFIAIFLFMDFFDTMGTLIGVSEQAGLIVDNKLPRASRAFFSDAVGTTVGAVLGTSTVTSYIESAAGVEEGGRTGFVAVVVAILFLVALFFSPIIEMVGSYPAITAPALVIVGSLMAKNAGKIEWSDPSESLPAFITIIGIPFTYSIGDGLALGFIAYPIVKLLSGKGKDVGWLMIGLAAILILYFIFVRSAFAG